MSTEVRSRGRVVYLFAMLAVVFLLPSVAAGDPAQSGGQPVRTGEKLYLAACASCHGVRGRGVDASQTGLEIPMPDFTDCSFATREPNADWLAVTHGGGPERAFANQMPAFGDSMSDAELELVLEYIRTFCSDKAWPRGELNLPRPIATEKAYPEDEAVITVGIATEGEASISNKLVYEKRVGARNQVELIVPFGWNQRPGFIDAGAGNWIGGLGDVAAGVKRAVYHDVGRGSIFSVAGEMIFPTGDRDKGYGKGTPVFEPFAAFGQVLPANFFLHAQAGAEFPFDTDRAEREGFWRAALGRSFESSRFGRSYSPMLEVLAARELVKGEKNQWDLLPQMQVTLSKRQHIMMSVGVRLPVTDRGPRKTEVLFYLLWDWFDGGFLQGW